MDDSKPRLKYEQPRLVDLVHSQAEGATCNSGSLANQQCNEGAQAGGVCKAGGNPFRWWCLSGGVAALCTGGSGAL
jgi:hypothetical protein